MTKLKQQETKTIIANKKISKSICGQSPLKLLQKSNSNCDKTQTQKLKFVQLKDSNYDKTKKFQM